MGIQGNLISEADLITEAGMPNVIRWSNFTPGAMCLDHNRVLAAIRYAEDAFETELVDGPYAIPLVWTTSAAAANGTLVKNWIAEPSATGGKLAVLFNVPVNEEDWADTNPIPFYVVISSTHHQANLVSQLDPFTLQFEFNALSAPLAIGNVIGVDSGAPDNIIAQTGAISTGLASDVSRAGVPQKLKDALAKLANWWLWNSRLQHKTPAERTEQDRKRQEAERIILMVVRGNLRLAAMRKEVNQGTDIPVVV